MSKDALPSLNLTETWRGLQVRIRGSTKETVLTAMERKMVQADLQSHFKENALFKISIALPERLLKGSSGITMCASPSSQRVATRDRWFQELFDQ